jgi:hypothetical protein
MLENSDNEESPHFIDHKCDEFDTVPVSVVDEPSAVKMQFVLLI